MSRLRVLIVDDVAQVRRDLCTPSPWQVISRSPARQLTGRLRWG
jgi:hypothetical protein